jgi:V/A-type H+-transporting ATPase subunit K
MDINMIGPAISLGLSAIGCSIGCWIAGSASHAAMARTEEGHGKFIALAAAPSSQVIYGFLLMLQMKNAILSGSLSPVNGIAIGICSGLAIAFSSVFQGKVCATGIQATLKQPSIYGKTFASVGIIESFALFAFVFALLII